MRRHSLCATLLLLGVLVGLTTALGPGRAKPDEGDAPARPARLLPGLQPDGFMLLANQWRLRPAGRQVELGDFPVNIAVHPDGRFVAVLHAGMRDHEIIVLDVQSNPARPRVVSRSVLDQTFYGLCFAPDGKTLFASGGEFAVVHAFEFAGGYLGNPRQLALGTKQQTARMVVGGVTTDAEGKTVFAACPWGDAVVKIPLADPEGGRKIIRLSAKALLAAGPRPPEKPETGGSPPSPPDNRAELADELPTVFEAYPYTCLAEPGGKRLFVSLWSRAGVAVIDLARDRVAEVWPTESHPTEMALAPDAKTLYVACSNSTRVSVLDVETGKPVQTIVSALYPQAPSGNTPNSLCLSPDGKTLYVANADASNLAVFDVTDRAQAKPLGFIPTGWYPTSVRYHAATKRLLVANGKGVTPKANPHGPRPTQPLDRNLVEYIGSLYQGTLSLIDLPAPQHLAAYTKQAYACSPLRGGASPVGDWPADNPIPRQVGGASPIKHVIYVIKENRTYDQMLGDMKEGNGAAELCLFPEAVTPNHHKLAREFVLLDNFYVDGEVSADGHEWSMAAYATDYVEKSWPLTYRGSQLKKLGYPSEGAAEVVARPSGGYVWDRCREKGVSYRSFGEFVFNGRMRPDGTFADGRAGAKGLVGHFDPQYRGFDLDYPDVKRAERFISELRRYEREGGFPRFIVMRLPNDHTTGTRLGKPTPTAMVADNDLALGMVAEAVTHSKFWPETAIFVLEDDAQNGPDHVDAHRSPALVVSPYTRRRAVVSEMYSTSSMLRTMELTLGLEPMSQFDAAARPMYACFQPTPDVKPYAHEKPRTNLDAKNERTAWGAERSERFDLTKEDAADDLLFNEVIWKSVKGAAAPMPAPVRAAFFHPHPEERKDRDDD